MVNSKLKNVGLVLLFVILLAVSYKLAFNKTLNQKEKYNILSETLFLNKSMPAKLLALKERQIYYDKVLLKYQLNGSSIQNNLLKFINVYASNKKLKINSFVKPHNFSENDHTIKTFRFEVEGDFEEINMLIYKLEQETKFGEVVNLHYEKKKHFKNNSTYLKASILLSILTRKIA